ncbi:MAG: NAD+ synthase, partial [Cyanobacteria bacterium J083]
MKIGIAQLNPIIGDINYNAEKIAAVAHIAAQQGIELLLTPELSLCGYPPKDLLLYPAFINSLQAKLLELAKIIPPELSLLVGTVEVNPTALQKGQKPLYNSIALLRQGKIEQIFHKRLLPNYDVFDEHRYFAPGAENNYFFLNRQKIGVTICEDLWNDEQFWGKRYYEVNPIAELAKLEVDIMINLSASPYYCQKQQLREAMLAHVTHTYHKPIIYVNQVGANDDLIFDGFSVALNATGEIVARAKSFETDLVVVEYDVNTNKLINPAPQPIRELTGENWQYQELFSALVLGVKDYTQKCGFQRAVFGLSGGIDSALVAIIATAALGTENVLAVLMPSPYSSQHSIKDAKELVANLGINSEIIPIEAGMKAFDQMLHPLFAGTEFGVAEENIQSRLRGNILMAISNKFGHLLLSTGN